MKTASLPTPTVDLIQAECDAFDSEDQLVEEALRLLRAQFPRNTVTSHVLLKVLVLNKLYNTWVLDKDVEPLARHIVELKIDPLLDQDSLAVVERITDCPPLRKYLSFASKFCSWHKPAVYPIWDGNARACLWAYRKQDPFTSFHNYDLWDYESFRATIVAFRDHYGLDCFTFRQLDKFLYRSGGRILRGEDRPDSR